MIFSFNSEKDLIISCSFLSHKNFKVFLKKILQLLNVYGKCMICKVLSAQGKANWNMTFLVMIWVMSRVSPPFNEDINSILFSLKSLQTSETFSGNADYAEWRYSHSRHLGSSAQQILNLARLCWVLGCDAGGITAVAAITVSAAPSWVRLHPEHGWGRWGWPGTGGAPSLSTQGKGLVTRGEGVVP